MVIVGMDRSTGKGGGGGGRREAGENHFDLLVRVEYMQMMINAKPCGQKTPEKKKSQSRWICSEVTDDNRRSTRSPERGVVVVGSRTFTYICFMPAVASCLRYQTTCDTNVVPTTEDVGGGGGYS